MSQKNLNVQNKTHKFLLDKLKDKRTLRIYKKFKKNFQIKKSVIVAVSGGPDSLALSFLTKIYSLKKSLDVKYFLVDHRLRINSTIEAKSVQKLLKNFYINLNILTWKGSKPEKNIQSISRDKRYKLLIKKANKFRIKNILLGHGTNGGYLYKYDENDILSQYIQGTKIYKLVRTNHDGSRVLAVSEYSGNNYIYSYKNYKLWFWLLLCSNKITINNIKNV